MRVQPSAPAREHSAAIRLGQAIGLRPNDPALPIEWLSGGNQQKVVVGRWLHLQAKVYVFEDPTAGVDVGAKAEIYRLFDVALKRGAAILLVSTDFEEVEKVCHRALVFDRGRVVAELGRRRPVGREPARRRFRQRRPGGGGADADRTRAGQPCNRLNPNALEPTRSELAGLTRWQAVVRILPIYGLPILTLVLAVFFSILLPDSFPTALNVRSILSDKGDHRAALARRDGADDGRAHRPDHRVRHRPVAHPGDQPAGLVPRALATGDAGRRAVRRAGRAGQRRCWSRWRRSTASSPRSAPARSFTRWRCGSPAGGR